MEVKAGSADIAIFIKMRLLGAVITLAAHKAQYGTPTSTQYTLVIKSVDETLDTTVDYDAAKSTSDALFFLLPDTLFAVKNRVLRLSLRFTFDTIIDSAKQNFEIKVTDPTSVNTK